MGKASNLRPDQIAAITALCKADHDNKYISEITGISLRSVQRWTKKFKDSVDGNVHLQKKPPGRPRKLSPYTLNLLKRVVDNEPSITVRQIREQNDCVAHVSRSTISLRLRTDLGFKRYAAKKKPLLTNRQVRNRLSFAKDKVKWIMRKHRRVLYSDEATFTVTAGRQNKVYRRPGSDPYDPKFTCATVKFPQKLMVWGAFSYHGLSDLIFLPVNETMNKEKYLELLSDNLYDTFRKCRINLSNGIFQQDGASCHTAKIIKEWFDFVQIEYISDWPGNSPDLNPIENLWAIMKGELRGRDTSSLPKLEREIRDVWANLDRDYLKNLIDSVPDRLNEVITRRGKITSY